MDIKHLLCTPCEPYAISKPKDFSRTLIADQHRPETVMAYSQPAVVYDGMYGSHDTEYYCSWSQYRQPASPTSDTISTHSSSSTSRSRSSRSSSVSSTESVFLNPLLSLSSSQHVSAFEPREAVMLTRSRSDFLPTRHASPGNNTIHYAPESTCQTSDTQVPPANQTSSRRARSASSPGSTPIQTRMAWTPLEDELLQKGYDEGLSWAMISASYLPHRSRGCCWGRFKTLQSKNLVDPRRQNARLFRRPWKTVNAMQKSTPPISFL